MFKLREGDFMVYEIKKIAGRSDLKRCHSFEISNFQWRSIYRPRARGCVGYIENKGFLVWLACEELHPKADCVRNYEPICMDSALVAFFRFDPACAEYFNFAFNARGSCLAGYGSMRHIRDCLSPDQICDLGIRSQVTADGWQILFLIPESIIFYFQPKAQWKKTRHIDCNFCKICEHPDIEHHGSFVPSGQRAEEFHRPEFFAQARII